MATKKTAKKKSPATPPKKKVAKKKTGSPPATSTNVFTGFAQARGVPVVLLLVDEINASHPVRLEHLLRGKSFSSLELVINSPGGSAHAAYQLVSLARLHADSVNVCVPYFAKSAATLVCLGADKIILGEVAELGPLDTQIREEEAAGKYRYASALNPSKAIDQLRRFSMETFDLAVRMILQRSDLDHHAACTCAIDFVKATTGQLFSDLDALKLGEYSRALAVGKEYGLRLLERYGEFDAERRRLVLDKLVEGYPSHDYIIDYRELEGLGFPVELLDADSLSAFSRLYRDENTDRQDLVRCVEP